MQTHLWHLLAKLDIASRTQLAVRVARQRCERHGQPHWLARVGEGDRRHIQRGLIVIKGNSVNGGRARRVSITDRAHQNRQYVRRLLARNSPEFAAVLDWVVWEVHAERRHGDAPVAVPRQAVQSTLPPLVLATVCEQCEPKFAFLPIWDGADEPAFDVRNPTTLRTR